MKRDKSTADVQTGGEAVGPEGRIPEREIGNSVVVQIKKNGFSVINGNIRVRRCVNDPGLSRLRHGQHADAGCY
jgi:hypothetical protein